MLNYFRGELRELRRNVREFRRWRLEIADRAVLDIENAYTSISLYVPRLDSFLRELARN